MGETVVVALGGNALLPPGEAGTVEEQFRHARRSLTPVVELLRGGDRVALVHGNGPQVGDELFRNELARREIPPLPLAVLVASTAGWIGYILQQSLENALRRAGIPRHVTTLITQVVVDTGAPGALEPVKPVGRLMDAEAARTLEAELGWRVREVEGGWRRVVPSPPPVEIVERDHPRPLVHRGHVVIAAGGGGIPVQRRPDGELEGFDGVVDKDLSAAVVAREVGARRLVILTNVDGVYREFGTPSARRCATLRAREAEEMIRTGEAGAGSMAPKLRAAVDFLRAGGERVRIGDLEEGVAVIRGREGTDIVP